MIVHLLALLPVVDFDIPGSYFGNISWKSLAAGTGLLCALVHFNATAIVIQDGTSLRELILAIISTDCQTSITLDVFLSTLACAMYVGCIEGALKSISFLVMSCIISPGAASALIFF